jgi:hypothetical protein
MSMAALAVVLGHVLLFGAALTAMAPVFLLNL